MKLKLALLAVVFSLALQIPARGQEGNAADVEQIKKEVLKIDEQVHEADARADIKTLDRIFADDMVWTARGDVLNKAQVLADFRTGNDKLKSIDHYNIHAHVYGNNTVILTGESRSTVEYKGKISKGPRLFTQVYVKLDGRWQLVSHQVTDAE